MIYRWDLSQEMQRNCVCTQVNTRRMQTVVRDSGTSEKQKCGLCLFLSHLFSLECSVVKKSLIKRRKRELTRSNLVREKNPIRKIAHPACCVLQRGLTVSRGDKHTSFPSLHWEGCCVWGVKRGTQPKWK